MQYKTILKKRIFVYKNITKNSEYNIYEGHTSNEVISLVNNHYHLCPNFGNKVWFQGVMSAIYNSNTEFGFLSKDTTPDFINENFNMVLLPMANIFNENYLHYIKELSEFFSKIKIPTIVLSCGAQACSYDDLSNLINAIGKESKQFISYIYNHGGAFGVRGEFTKLFFEKLGFSDVTVTGCPSIYQNGNSLSLSNEKNTLHSFKYIVNGSVNSFSELFENKNSVYIDQYSMYKLLFEHIDSFDISSQIKQLIRQYNYLTLRLASENRIQLFANPNDWRKYIIDNNFSFSIGSRIHGSVMSILSGIPAAMCPIDSRTQEMAEFYKIPIVERSKLNSKSVYDIYCNLDYSEFNKQYKVNYDRYCQFLIKTGLTDVVNQNNIFFDSDKEYIISEYPNEDLLAKIKKELSKNSKKYIRYEKNLNMIRKIVSIFR